jgi:RNA polymerase sigma-70 factor (ECF subfamily)
MSGAAESEREMVAQLQRGEAAAIASIYDSYGRLAYSLAYRILNDAAASEDVVQDAFLALWRNAVAFDASRGSLRAWLLSIVHHRAVDRLRGTAPAGLRSWRPRVAPRKLRMPGRPYPRSSSAARYERPSKPFRLSSGAHSNWPITQA